MQSRKSAFPSLGTGLLALVLPACARGSPRWVALAPLFQPSEVERVAGGAGESGQRTTLDPHGTWVDHAIPGGAWQPDDRHPNEWWTARPDPTPSLFQVGRWELGAGEQGFRELSDEKWRDSGPPSRPGDFCMEKRRLRIRLSPGSAPPPSVRYSRWYERGTPRPDGWRAIAGDVVAQGLSLWPGERWEIRRDFPRDSALRVSTVLRALGSPGRVEFRIDCDGEPLLVHEQEITPEGSSEHHVLSLPAGRASVRLGFEVRGDRAATLFAAPVVGPLAIGGRGHRPWQDPRPDVVLFLADTFRADNLAAYGGSEETTPNLDRLAQRSVRFLDARSNATWTLPAHGTLFTGLLPTQHGALTSQIALDQRLVTLAERFAASGYRTGAVTDGLYVSRTFGLDQGFQWWSESDMDRWDLRRTLAQALDFVERDDGRPLFLFVHTYRTHLPYRVGAEESRAELRRLASQVASGGEGRAPEPPGEGVAAYRALYLEGVRGLDEQFGPWFSELERHDVFSNGYFVFTSDHGEAFFEHGKRGHKWLPHEELIRVPLLLFGAELEPRDAWVGAGLADVAPTLAELCQLPPDPLGAGNSLLGPRAARPLFSFHQETRLDFLAVIQGDRKLISEAEAGSRSALLQAPAFREAYELGADPREQANRIESASWPGELARAAATLWARESRVLVEAAAAVPAPERIRELEALGYGE